MDLRQLDLLRTDAGAAALKAAARLVTGDPLAAAAGMRAAFEPSLASAALTQAALRRQAIAKFGPRAEEMYFTRPGLEQATRRVVAQRRAARLVRAGATAVADLGCGIGSDLLAMTEAGLRAHGVDADPVTAACAALNAPSASVHTGDALAFDLTSVDAAFCDPARRRLGTYALAAGGDGRPPAWARGGSGNRRVFDPNDYSPPWEWVSALPRRMPRTVLKLAPGIDQALIPGDAELELVSVDGDVVEATAWCGPLREVPRRATVIRDGQAHSLTGTGLQAAPVGPARAYLFDPDGAVVRAHLVAEFAQLVDGGLADASIAYVWAASPHATAFGRCFAVDEVMPFSLKRLRTALRSRGVGRVEILKRGSALDVEELRKSLRLSGSNPASVILTRIAGAPTAIIATPV